MKKILKVLGLVLIGILVVFFITRFIGMQVNKIVPKNGINKSM